MSEKINRIKHFLFNADVSEEEYESARSSIEASNRNSLLAFTTIAFCFMVCMFAVSFFVEVAAMNRIPYACSAAALAFIHLLARKRDLSSVLLLLLVYIFLSILMAFGIVLGTVTLTDQIAASFIALLLTVPLLFVDRPIRMNLFILAAACSFLLFDHAAKIPDIFATDAVNAIVFGAVSMFTSSYMMSVKVKRFTLESRIRYMSETDQLTGLKNRNCYEHKLSAYRLYHADSFFCIYVDVNGLHELNNTQGHEAGDRMLQFIAKELQNRFGENDTYRIGGDEYVAFGYDLSEDEIRKKTADFNQTVIDAGYHVAIGTERIEMDALNIDHLIKQAESKMYADKRAYYTTAGRDRRKR